MHASDLGSAKALRKFKPGQVVAGRVLTADPGERGCLRRLLLCGPFDRIWRPILLTAALLLIAPPWPCPPPTHPAHA